MREGGGWTGGTEGDDGGTEKEGRQKLCALLSTFIISHGKGEPEKKVGCRRLPPFTIKAAAGRHLFTVSKSTCI